MTTPKKVFVVCALPSSAINCTTQTPLALTMEIIVAALRLPQNVGTIHNYYKNTEYAANNV